ncbi:MAG: DUF4468 domain-containing protein [Clostridium sp.]|nr:DUF4468 domain-containing protein [Clostridium sp.]
MKKILLLLLCTPFLALAQDKHDSKYLAGAVPEENGQVIFRQTFAAKDKTQAQIYTAMLDYAKQLVADGIESPRTRITSEDPANGLISLRSEEWMVFKKKPLYLDRTRFRYQLIFECQDGKCKMTLTQISYYYREDNDGSNGVTYKAEEWINDKNAINKAGNKLYPVSAKFRRCTVERVESIFTGARDVFELPVVERKRATEIINE